MDPDAPAEVIARAVETYGGLDVLVNNAGGPPPGDRLPHQGFLTRDDAQWTAMLEFNLLSAVRACRAALPLLLERNGTIVNVVSAVARQPAAMNVDYCAAKAALLNLTKALQRGVRAARRAREQRLARPDPHAVVDRRGRRGGHRRGLDRQRRRAGRRDRRARS